MQVILLSDFGSTYTKLTAVDLEKEELVGTSSSFTTIESDIQDGYRNALKILFENTDLKEEDIVDHKSCSSAAGGLRMLVSGLVPELTSEAARMAALGAGAKVLKTYAHEMTDDDIDDIKEIKPDIFLLTGGTDGGNKACILENAELLTELKPDFPIIVAGNRAASSKIRRMFEAADINFKICPNVMPKLGTLNIEPVQSEIREVFLERIIKAKGLSEIKEMISGIMMPTPAAVLAAMELLAEGSENEKGIGELLGVDPGGATTDVYSVADGSPRGLDVVLKGLEEPYKKRTVEGDIGMRYSIHGIVEAGGVKKLAELAGLSEDEVPELVDELAKHTDRLPDSEKMQRLDDALASVAVETAVKRHCGTMEEAYTNMGKTFVQAGKDLREVKRIVVTGGALVRAENTAEIAKHALYSPQDPGSLRPKKAEILIDRKYILSAMGVLAQSHPDTALRIMKKELVNE